MSSQEPTPEDVQDATSEEQDDTEQETTSADPLPAGEFEQQTDEQP